MVDLSSGTEGGPIEHRFDDWIFVGPTVVIVMLVGKWQNSRYSTPLNWPSADWHLLITMSPSYRAFALSSWSRSFLYARDFSATTRHDNLTWVWSKSLRWGCVSSPTVMIHLLTNTPFGPSSGECVLSSFYSLTDSSLTYWFTNDQFALSFSAGFFGYKLFQSLQERERKRHEKKKLKQQKKSLPDKKKWFTPYYSCFWF